MFRILVDTCVWLDLAKDHKQQSLLSVLEELIKLKEVTLIVPRTVVIEFNRNKERIAKESGRSLSGVFKQVKDAVDKFGDPRKRRAMLRHLNDLDYKIPLLGEAANTSIARISALLNSSSIIELSDEIKLRAAQRAIDRKAPFHLQRNSINDSIIIETYLNCVQDKNAIGRFAFVTHNTKDFSDPIGHDKNPHPDIAMFFSKIKSLYFIKLAEAIKRVRPALVTELMLDQEWTEEARSLTEIVESIGELIDKIWYNRHQNRKYGIKHGEIKIVKKEKARPYHYHENTIQRDIWEGAKKSARQLEKKYGKKNLGPWTDFEWGMMNGKLSALRWALGEEWDMLDI